MKYGESAFCVLYLLFAVTAGCLILRKAGKTAGRLMGAATLILGIGERSILFPVC